MVALPQTIKPARGLVEYDGVAAGDALHQRIMEARLATRRASSRRCRPPRRSAWCASNTSPGYAPAGSTSVRPHAQACRAPRRRSDRNRYNSRRRRRIASEAEKVLDEALSRSIADVDRRGAEPVLVLRHDRRGIVTGAVIGHEQPPVGEALIGEGGKLGEEEPCTVIRTQQYGDTRHNDDGARQLTMLPPLACLARR